MSDIENPATTTVHYPSDVVPAPPEFDIDLPNGWEIGQVPGVLLASGPTSWEGPFRPNVTVAHGLAPRDVDPLDLARGYVEDMAEGSFEVIDLDRLDEDSAQLIVTLELADPAIQVLQSIVVVKVDNRPPQSGLTSVLTITASTSADRGEQDGPVLLDIVRSVRIEVPTYS